MRKQVLSLDGPWLLCGFDGYGQRIDARELPPALENLPWLDADVPGSVYRDLMRAGWLPDLYAGCNTLAARWVEDTYWYYRRRFDAPAEHRAARCSLVLDGLDLDALVFLNRRPIAEHHNAFRPLRIDVSRLLKERDNELIVRIDAGLLAAADKRGGDYNLEVTALATKRAHLRKPHFGCRWDWAPRLMNVGIGKSVRLEACDMARLDDVVVTPELSDDQQSATLHVRAHVENVTRQPQPLTLRCRSADEQSGAEVSATVAPGAGDLRCALPIAQPRLWWPRPLGEPHLYKLDIELHAGGELVDAQRLTTGIRSVALRQEPDPTGGRFFHLLVNGEPVFCKGANWVPADLLYPTVRPADYDQLVALAVECGCNMLRIWGGGLYADHALLAACDRAGVLVWHDLMFACSKFPGDEPTFAAEVEAEVRHNVRALAHHPSLALWCGNNEVDVGIRDGWIDSYTHGSRPCHDLFHRRFADIVAAEDGSRPYWPTSPWSPDGSHPAQQNVGDQHPWNVSLGPAKGDYWHYRRDASRFPNEGGMLGPSTRKTLDQILPPAERHIGSRTWLHHDNTQNTWRGEPLLDDLLKVNLSDLPRALPFDDYQRYAGLLHGEALETAIDNWRRRKFATAAAVFWMFNDTWPATVSWTPIDYYRRRKPAFWYVKRAFADVRAICVECDSELAVFVVNDLRTPQEVRLHYGLFGLAGGRPVDEQVTLTCPANATVVAARVPLATWDRLGTDKHGAFAVLTTADGETVTQRLFRQRFKELAWVPAEIDVRQSDAGLALRSDRFAWAVCLDADGETPLADNYFDLIPGIERVIPWPAGRSVPTLVVGNLVAKKRQVTAPDEEG